MISAALLAAVTVTTAPVLPSSAAPRAVVEAVFVAFNRHDPAAMAVLYAPNARLTSSDFCTPRTGRDVERTYRALFAELPDLHDTIETVLVDGERVAVRFTARSEAAAMALPIMTLLRVRDGRIVEDDSLFDNGGQPCTP